MSFSREKISAGIASAIACYKDLHSSCPYDISPAQRHKLILGFDAKQCQILGFPDSGLNTFYAYIQVSDIGFTCRFQQLKLDDHIFLFNSYKDSQKH